MASLVRPVPAFIRRDPRRGGVIGRRDELARIGAALERLAAGVGGRLVVQGEAGIGKSALVGAAIAEARRRGLAVLHGECLEVEQATSYFVWRAVLAGLLGHDLAAARGRLDALLAGAPALARLAPLLDDIVPLGLLDDAVTRELTGKLRQDNTDELVLGLLARATATTPALLVVDDTQWIDAASWSLLRRLHARGARLLLLLVGRPDDRVRLDDSGLQGGPDTLLLGPLDADDVAALAADRLGVRRLAPDVLGLLLARAGGRPFFTEQLACALRDAGLVELVDDTCRLRLDVDDPSAPLLPRDLPGVIAARIDRLSPAHVLTLKVASVIGRLFHLDLLRAVHPVEKDPAALRTALAELAALDLTAPEPALDYAFKHLVTHEVVYGLTLAPQRRDLHRAVAEWIERSHDGDLGPHALRLAHHWERAGRIERAIELILQALERAHRLSAGRDIDALIRRLRELCERHDHRLDDDRALQLDYYAAMGLVARGRHDRARLALIDLLARLDIAVPRRDLGLDLGIGAALLRQGLARRLAWFAPRPPHLSPARARMAVSALNILVGLGMIASDAKLTGYATMKLVGLGDGWAPPEELAQAHALAAVLASSFGDDAGAERYLERAHALAGRARTPQRCFTLVLAAILPIGRGDWARLDPLLDEAIELAAHLGDRQSAAFALVYRGDANLIRGRVGAAASDFRASTRHFEEMGNRAGRRTFAAQLARIDLHHGRLLAVVTELAALLDDMLDRREHHGVTLPLAGPLIEAYLMQDRLDEALAVDRRLARLLDGLVPSTHGFYRLFAAQAELWLAVAARDPATRRHARARAREALARLRRTATVFPIGRPSLRRLEGQLAAVDGDLDRAGLALADAARLARRLGYRREEALALYHTGLHRAGEAPAAASQQARDLFDRLGMPAHAARCAPVLRRG